MAPAGRMRPAVHRYIALVDASDPFHEAAVRYLDEAEKLNVRWVTSEGVIGETHTWLHHNTHFDVAIRYLDGIIGAEATGTTHIVYARNIDVSRVRDVLARFSNQKISYVDAASLVIASKTHVSAVFSFDFHLGLTGLNLGLFWPVAASPGPPWGHGRKAVDTWTASIRTGLGGAGRSAVRRGLIRNGQCGRSVFCHDEFPKMA
jgi:predicted nucleic acid-binding protein